MLAALSLLALALSPAQEVGALRPVDPRSWTSPLGHATLSVDGTDARGRGPAHYVLRVDGRTLWRGERAYTLVVGSVAETGDVVGYSLSADALDLVALDPAGVERWSRRIERTFMPLHGPAYPAPRGLAFDARGDRVALQMLESAAGGLEAESSWRIYRAGTGEPLGEWRDGESVEIAKQNGAASALLAAMPRAAAAYTTAWGREEPLRGASAPAPSLDLLLLREVELEPRPGAGGIFGAVVDARGRLLFPDEAARVVHVWDGRGARTELSGSSAEAWARDPNLIALPKERGGGVLVQLRGPDGRPGNRRTYAHFGAADVAEETIQLARDDASFPAGTEGSWSWSRFEPPIRVSAGGEGSGTPIERLPDRRWLHPVDDAAALEDGGLAVLSRGALSLYAGDGTPRGMAQLVSERTAEDARGFASLVVAGGRALVQGGKELWIVELVGLSVRRCELSPYGLATLSPDGRELRSYSLADQRLRVYAIP